MLDFPHARGSSVCAMPNESMTTLATWLERLPLADGVRWAATPGAFSAREAPYLALRAREGRLYDDATVARLPDPPPGRLQAREWRWRADSAARLAAHLARQTGPDVLEVGCGNGWLARYIGAATSARVCGLDVNAHELLQAARTNAAQPSLTWVYGDLFDPGWPADGFDTVVFASSLHYFPDAPAAIHRALTLTRQGGEVHVLDSPLYASHEIAAANARTRAYCAALGVPDAAGSYMAHARDALSAAGARVLHDPSRPGGRVLTTLGLASRSPFPWLCWTRR